MVKYWKKSAAAGSVRWGLSDQKDWELKKGIGGGGSQIEPKKDKIMKWVKTIRFCYDTSFNILN